MNSTWSDWLAMIEQRIVDRRDSTSCLVLVVATLPILLLIFGMQCLAAQFDFSRALYRESWMIPSLWGQSVLILWLAVMGWQAWRRQHVPTPLPWLVQLTVLPAGPGIVLLALSYGIKDTPMGMVLLAAFFFARAFLSLRQLRWGLSLCVVLAIGAEVAESLNWLPYAPLLAAPVYQGDDLKTWWAVWTRVLLLAAAVPVSGLLFLVAATLHKRRQDLETLVRTDMLTGLANRREFMTRLEREAHRQSRSGRPLAVAMFDVDHFKRVNDTWGHPAGDEVLARIGHILRSQTREHVDTAARYGGEEFILLLPETDLAGARHVAEKISAKLQDQDFVFDGQTFKVTQSVGIAQVDQGDVATALKVADRNLYEAKQAGRDRIVATVAFADDRRHA